ncbi:MAG TPA: CxxH/CxxC protein [Paenibacillaceae bacterium]|nr:CxxH/CxxC protein [Paenibacillaceae bacterium]
MDYILGSCMEHLEFVIDEFVDEVELAPNIVRVTEFTGDDQERPTRCLLCEKPVEFILFK